MSLRSMTANIIDVGVTCVRQRLMYLAGGVGDLVPAEAAACSGVSLPASPSLAISAHL